MSNSPETAPQLQRTLKPVHVWSLALGAIIGWGAFVMPGNTFLPNAGPLGAAIALGIGALIMIIISINYSYMINHYPVAGGEFTYASSAFGKTSGFICAWFLGLSYLAIVPLNATALALIGRNLVPSLTQWGYLYSVEDYGIYAGEVLLAVVALVFFAWACIRGVATIGKFQTVLAFGIVGSVLLLVIAALFSPHLSLSNLTSRGFITNSSGEISFPGIIAVVAVAPWAFVGFDSVPQASEEFCFNVKKCRRIMILSIIIGAVLYITLTFLAIAVMPEGYTSWQDYLADTQKDPLPGALAGLSALPVFNAAKLILGTPGLVLLGVALLCAVLSGILGFYMATSRLLFSMAREKVLPAWFGKLHPKTNTPYNAILFILAISLIAPWFGRTVLNWIVDMSSVGAAVGYGFTSAAVLVIAHRKKDAGWVTKLNAVLGVFFALLFVALLVVPNKWAYLGIESRIALIAWVLLGALFFITNNIKNKKEMKAGGCDNE